MPLTLASQITVLRIMMIPLVAVSLLYRWHEWAFLLFTVAAISDAADGIIARRLNQTTSTGALLDALADMLLVLTVVIILATMPEPLLGLPIWLVALIVWRDLQIMIGILILQTMHSPLQWKPLKIGKANTIAMILLMGTTIFINCLIVRDISADWLFTIHSLMVWVVLVTTAISWYRYTVWGFSILHGERNGNGGDQ